MDTLWNMLPDEFTFGTMYNYIKFIGEGLLPRNHPTKEGHKGWSNLLIKELIQ